MDFTARNIEMLAKGIAVLVVFIISISLPLAISNSLQERARDAVIRSSFNQIKNWAQIYVIRNGTYEGLAMDLEIRKVVEHIYLQGGSCLIFGNNNEYCAKTTFNNGKRGTLCIDSSGYIGSHALNCRSDESASCE